MTENQEELTESISEFLLNQNAKEKAEKIKKEIGGMLLNENS
jgi:hypothetical protein